MNGHGTMTYRNGDLYTGEWRANQREGQGKMTYINDTNWEGKWLNDQKVYLAGWY